MEIDERVAKDVKLLKRLSYVTMGILGFVYVCLVALWLFFTEKSVRIAGNEEDRRLALFMVGMTGFFVLLALVFGFLNLKKYKVSLAVTYMILGELAFYFCVGQFIGAGTQTLPFLALMAIPHACIIKMQCQIKKKCKSCEGE